LASVVNVFDKNLLSGKKALITGGGAGLGLAIATRFAKLGASVVICGRREAILNSAVASIRETAGHDHVGSFVCDVRYPESVRELMEKVWETSPLDILVNNAAASFIAQTHRLSHRAADAVLAPTLHGALYCTLEVGRRWIDAAQPGVVLSILSTSTLTGRAFTVPSAMAKAAVLAMTRSLAVEWGPRRIRLIAIAPGAFPTPGAEAQLNPDDRRRSGGSPKSLVPLGRVGQPGELADLACYVVSDAAAYMTGEMVVLDGGLHLRTSGVDDLLQWSDDKWETHRKSRLATE
jgi:NAD(P)-dependent dehydrogenase (short-subunit alcohol dehydrogenase family)